MWPPRFHDINKPKSTLPEDATIMIQIFAFWLNCFLADFKSFFYICSFAKDDPHCGPHPTSGKMI